MAERHPPPGARRKNPVGGGLAVLLVGGVVAGTVCTGPRPVTVSPAAASAAPSAAALRALVVPVPARTRPDPRARAVSRATHRHPLHRWVRPFGGYLSSGFGMRWGRLHAGIDLAGPYGAPIVAATDGCISYAGPMSGYGEVMMISDWDGTETVYGHMSSFVRRSGCVQAGQVIARIGAAGDATGPHLHFEVRVGGAPVDPIPFLARRGVRV